MSDKEAFELASWRAGRDGRRALARRIVADALEQRHIEAVLLRTRMAIGYDRLDEADKNSAKVMFSQLRNIYENWHRLDEAERDAFLGGRVPYSTTSKLVSEREPR